MTHSFLRTARSLAALALACSLACACVVEEVGGDQNELTAGDDAEPCTDGSAWRSCEQDIDPEVDGVQVCMGDGEGNQVWSTCEPHYLDEGPEDCSPGSTWNGSCCMTEYHCCETDPVCNTPLVLSFDDQPVSFAASQASFDLSRTGLSVSTDWPGADTPWLVLDRNANGRIDDGGELFGSATRIGSSLFADNGFQALAQLDANGDGFITAADPGFAELQLWSDRDQDRASSPAELSSGLSRGLVAIQLDYHSARRCDARNNCEAERARFWFRDDTGTVRSGSVIDVHLASR